MRYTSRRPQPTASPSAARPRRQAALACLERVLPGPGCGGRAPAPAASWPQRGPISRWRIRRKYGQGFGVYGKAPNGAGVLGESTAWFGVYGKSTNQTGVVGESSSHDGVRGTTTAANRVGVRGVANATGGVGIWGESDASTGVFGTSGRGVGVWGQAGGANTVGVKGVANSAGAVGVWGESAANTGVYGQSGAAGGAALWGKNTAGGIALKAEGNAVQSLNMNGLPKAMALIRPFAA